MIAAWAAQRVAADALPDLRQQIGSAMTRSAGAERKRESSSFLKHADEQTIVGLAAVFEAIRTGGSAEENPEAGSTPGRFRDWGVVACPRFLGRSAMVATLQRFRAEGAWGVSPHLIPHHSLHSLSGTISQFLAIHGPNFGTGGGPGGEREALLTAFALLHGQQLPGVWVVCTRLDPESAPDDAGRIPSGCYVEGLALALTRPREADLNLRRKPTLHLEGFPPGGSVPPSSLNGHATGNGRLTTLWDLPSRSRSGDAPLVLTLGGGLRCVTQW
jgi:hypothetical protein